MLTANPARVFNGKFNAKIWRSVPSNRSGAGEACARTSRQSAFTFIEVMVSLALLTMLTVCATWAFGQMNTSAVSSRVNSCAQMVAQNYIDGFLSAEPYNPQSSPTWPAQLPQFSASPVCTMAAPQTVNGTVRIYTDPNSEPFTDSNGNQTWDVGEPYTDLNSNGVWDGTLIAGTVTLDVADLALNQTTNGVTQSLNARRLRVTIEYTFKGKPFTVAAGRAVVLNTIRVSDF